MSEIWRACQPQARSRTLSGVLLRLVESQEEIATEALVDSLAEQAVLERLIERSKPRLSAAGELHYLLSTPFRYPPLPHGSRFGGRHEPSLCYGALGRATLIMEASYYRFVFLAGMSQPCPTALRTRHTAFSARYRCRRGLHLEQAPFVTHQAALRSATDYGATQALGRALREAGIEAFTFASARDPAAGSNIALFTPTVFAEAAPRGQSHWTCEARAERLTWREQAAHAVITVSRDTFLVKGLLPAPAV